MENRPIRVLIADDHQVITDGIELMLQDEAMIDSVAIAVNGQDVLDQLAILPVDVILMDLQMPVLDGLETCTRIKKSFPDVKVLFLTMTKEVSMIKKTMKAGSDGYLLKYAGKEEIIHAIKTVAAGESYLGDEVEKLIISSFSLKKSKTTEGNPKISRREKQVLQLICEEYTTQEIAEKLFVSAHTVESHRRNLLIKMGARNSVGLVKMALENGLLEG